MKNQIIILIVGIILISILLLILLRQSTLQKTYNHKSKLFAMSMEIGIAIGAAIGAALQKNKEVLIQILKNHLLRRWTCNTNLTFKCRIEII